MFINFVLCLSEFPGQTTANPNIMTGESYLDQTVQKEWTKMGYSMETDIAEEWAFSDLCVVTLPGVVLLLLPLCSSLLQCSCPAHSHYPQLLCLL